MNLLPALQPVDLPPEPIVTPDVAWSAVLPTVVLIVGALGLMVVVALSRRKPIAGAYTLYTTVVAVCAIIAALPLWDRIRPFVPSQSTLDDLDALSLTDPAAAQQLAQELGLKAAEHGPYTAMAGSIGVDGFSVFVTIVICLAVILTAWTADDYLRREGLEGPELSVLLLLSAAGGVVMASANDLIVMFLGLEILSIAVYVLAAMHRKRLTSQEAGVKYFVLGAFSSAFLLYGIAFVYGGTGSTNLVRIVDYFSTTVIASNGLVLAGLALMLVGFGFKVAAAPFHWWTPDVYQGSPTPVVTFMASAVKAAGFAGLLRVFYLGFETWQDDWKPIVFALAVLTLLVGSIIAVVQTNVKRMLAYSSIGHAGFMLVGVQVASELGVAAVLFYLAAYTFMVAGSFAVVTVVGREGDGAHRLSDYRGLAETTPWAGVGVLDLPVRPGRGAPHLGLLRQVLRHRRSRRRQLGGSGHHRHARRGHLGLHLPADHRRDVLRGRRRPRAPSDRHPAGRPPDARSMSHRDHRCRPRARPAQRLGRRSRARAGRVPRVVGDTRGPDDRGRTPGSARGSGPRRVAHPSGPPSRPRPFSRRRRRGPWRSDRTW